MDDVIIVSNGNIISLVKQSCGEARCSFVAINFCATCSLVLELLKCGLPLGESILALFTSVTSYWGRRSNMLCPFMHGFAHAF